MGGFRSASPGVLFMALTKGKLRALLDASVMRPDKADQYDEWIDTALREIQTDHSWECMRTSAQVTISSGEQHVALPDNFKELQPLLPPMWVTSAGLFEYPVEVKTREQLMAYPTSLYFPITPARIGARNALPVFLERVDGRMHVWVTMPVADSLLFRVSHFGYLSELDTDDATNELLERYPTMVKDKLFSIAYADIQDPVAAGYETAYMEKRARAILSDKNRRMSGVAYRMGG